MPLSELLEGCDLQSRRAPPGRFHRCRGCAGSTVLLLESRGTHRWLASAWCIREESRSLTRGLMPNRYPRRSSDSSSSAIEAKVYGQRRIRFYSLPEVSTAAPDITDRECQYGGEIEDRGRSAEKYVHRSTTDASTHYRTPAELMRTGGFETG